MSYFKKILASPTKILILGILAVGLTGLASADEKRRTFSSDRLTVHNLIGEIRIESGGSEFEVVVNVQGAGASRGVVRLEVSDEELQVLFPDEQADYVYPRMGARNDARIRLNQGDWLPGMSGSRERIQVSGSGSGLELWADVTIRVPNGAELIVKHGVGAVIADGVDGDLKLATRTGDIRVDRIYGELSIATGSGSVSLGQVEGGDINVATGSGDVTADGVNGNEVSVATGSGDIVLRDVNGDELSAATGSGDITARQVSMDSVSVGTGSGDVELGLVQVPGRGKYKVGTGSGDIELFLPSGASAEVHAETDRGRVEVELGGELQYRLREKDEIKMTVGGGDARVSLGSGSGDIRIAH